MHPLPPKQLATAAFTASGLFAFISVEMGRKPQPSWLEYVGLGFHLTLLPLAAQLPAPTWARAMGYAWLAVDSIVSGSVLNGTPTAAAMPYRLGGHVLAGIRLAGASQALPTPARWLGRALALCLGGNTLVAPLTKGKPPVLLYASSPLMVGWLAVVGGLLRRRAAATAH